MRILVIGSGAREHALVWKISQSKRVTALYCAPGNPGIAALAQCVSIAGTDITGLLQWAMEQHIDLTVVGPEQPLAEGIVDLFEQRGLRIFGPSKAAARLEWSKGFAKEFMQRHHIPSAAHRTFSSNELDAALTYVRAHTFPLVLKADGLAAGKGVIICQSSNEAVAALEDMMSRHSFGAASDTVVVEEFMEGEEASVFAVCDGTSYVVLAPAQDHKRVLDGDRGKNTGGMGAYAPAPIVTPEVMQRIIAEIVEPTLSGMRNDGHPYKGCLYVGVMITTAGPKVVEYNSRFGDPETQVVLPLFGGDFVELLIATASGNVQSVPQTHAEIPGAAVCVVLASHGYPDKYTTGHEIHGLHSVSDMKDVAVFHGGTNEARGRTITRGGRVLSITAFSARAGLSDVVARAYEAVNKISFEGMHYRRDIAHRALSKNVNKAVQAI